MKYAEVGGSHAGLVLHLSILIFELVVSTFLPRARTHAGRRQPMASAPAEPHGQSFTSSSFFQRSLHSPHLVPFRPF